METFAKLFERFLVFVYHCFDRIVMGVALLDLRLPGYEGSFAGARTPMTFLPS